MEEEKGRKTAEYLRDLNEAQLKAVKATGSVLVLAGAGAGKTKTITSRIVHLIKNGVPPETILAVTFTNKAAGEMRNRVLHMLSQDRVIRRDTHPNIPFLSTFHGLCVNILREHGEKTGIPTRFTIFDRSNSRQAVKDAMVELGIDTKQIEPAKILSRISREKGSLKSSSSLTEDTGEDFGNDMVGKIWERYDALLKKQKALDFDDLLLETVRLIEKNTDVRDTLRARWTHIHVDEYQDTNRVQYELVRLLAEPRKELFVVGDIDQTIYTWRGAHIKNLLHFERDFPGTTVVILEENYRSTKTVLDAANAIIKKNTVRYEKTLRGSKEAGEPIGIYSAYDENDEASFVAHKAEELIANGTPAREIAVLYRANFQSRALEQAFLEARVPYQVLGTRFFERREVKDVLSFLRAAENPESTGDLKRVINVPPRGIGKLTFLKVLAGKEGELNVGQRAKVTEFRKLLARIRESMKQKPSDAVRFVIQESGLEKVLSHGSEEDKERLENIRELATVAASYNRLPKETAMQTFLSDVALRSEQDELKEDTDAVRLMTVHASKGLEFDCVFITGLEQDLFPHPREIRRQNIGEAEEERRLFYVALTRARKRIFLSYTNVRTIFGTRIINAPSEFLSDLEDIPCRLESPPTNYLKVIKFD